MLGVALQLHPNPPNVQAGNACFMLGSMGAVVALPVGVLQAVAAGGDRAVAEGGRDGGRWSFLT
jgi:hypothetical protein